MENVQRQLGPLVGAGLLLGVGLGGFLGYIQESLPQSARIRTTVRLTF